jgi:hypothetical protein
VRRNGLGYPNHGIDVHCVAITGSYWVYVRDTTTGVNGWARYDALNFSGTVTIPVC